MHVLFYEDSPADSSLIPVQSDRAADGPISFSRFGRPSDAVSALSSQSFDAVLLRLEPNVPQSLELLRSLHSSAPALPIVVLLPADCSGELLAECAGLAQDFILSQAPEEAELQLRLQQALERSRLQRALTDAERLLTRNRATLSSLEMRYLNMLQLHEASNRELRGLAALRDKLISMIVHDLRTPLSSVAMALEAMGDPPRPELVDALTWKLTHEQVDYGIELCTQLLDIKRMQEARLPVTVSDTGVYGSIQKAVSAVSTIAHAREIGIEVNCGEFSWPTDHQMLSRIVLNLLSNAVKFSPRQGVVQVDARQDGIQLRLSVRDEGPGIEPEMHSRIFELYGAALDVRIEGTGIGLSYCRLACETLHGTIGVVSTPGRGAIFHVELPRIRQADFHPRVEPRQNVS